MAFGPRARLVPVLALLALIVARAVSPDWLATRPVDVLPVSWWSLLFWGFAWVAAWMWSPPFVALVGQMGRRFFIPPLLFGVLILGLMVVFDLLWAATVTAWGGPQFSLLQFVVTTVSGGSPS